MTIKPLPENLEYLLPEIHCYQTNLQQRRLRLMAHLLPGLPVPPAKRSYRPTGAPSILLPHQLRPILVLSATYRIN